MKKVLIILYYWPPSGGSGVQRWLKFSKYLPEFGWQPVVYAPANAQYPETDPTLEKEIHPEILVIKPPIFEPHGLYKGFVGLKKGEKMGAAMTLSSKPSLFSRLKNNLSIWIRGNLFIPDARMFWIRPSVRFLKRFLRDNPADIMVTSGPPHSIHMIGYHLKKSIGLQWVADFRDPWTNIDFYRDLKLTRMADRRHHKLENKVLTNADHVIAIGSEMKKEFLASGAKNVSVITNGYDTSDMIKDPVEPDQKFSLLHVGTLPRSRNPEILWKALSKMVNSDSSFAASLEIKLTGNVDFSVIDAIKEAGLANYLSHISFLPHQEAMKQQKSAWVLLLLINRSHNAKGVITGKFFEYLASGRPVLMIGPEDGDAAVILNETGAGLSSGFDDEEKLISNLRNYYEFHKKGLFTAGKVNAAMYTRFELTKKLVRELDALVLKHDSENTDH